MKEKLNESANTSKILIIEDDQVVRNSIKAHLKKAGYEFEEAENGESGIEKAEVFQPDLIILDISMPKMNGIEVCKRLREDYRHLDAFIIMLSGKNSPEDKIKGLDIGADDYISKPHNPEELLARIRVGLRTVEAKRLALIDPLTKLYNRHYFNAVFSQEVSRSLRYKTELSMLVLDIDHFKKINDTYGHATGDTVLKQFASILLENSRKTDVCARWGGEEFTIILPLTDIKGAAILAEKIRKMIAEFSFTEVGRVTVSIGYAAFEDNGEDLFERTDKALYKAKESGRNKSVAG